MLARLRKSSRASRAQSRAKTRQPSTERNSDMTKNTEPQRCEATTTGGRQCRMPADGPDRLCSIHRSIREELL